MKHGSLWLFHIALADQLYGSGNATPRTAMDLFGELLRDPQPADWATDPMESLAVLTTPHPQSFEHWFEVAVERREPQMALEVADRARRHRFFSSLDLGGRLESLRWILESAPEYLPQPAQLQRQDILSRYPEYDKLSRESRSIRQSLARKSLVAQDQQDLKEQTRGLSVLAANSLRQEAMLREIALRREPAALVLPPVASVADVQKSLAAKAGRAGLLRLRPAIVRLPAEQRADQPSGRLPRRRRCTNRYKPCFATWANFRPTTNCRSKNLATPAGSNRPSKSSTRCWRARRPTSRNPSTNW